jgi:hypothetical protein
LHQRCDKVLDSVLQFHEQGIGLVEMVPACHRFEVTCDPYHRGGAQI